ncbi:Hypothetical protein GLP15_4945 [Giardia lamblia P15]|uniref:Uncharacterized protein n=1 Tax=Giardia intestinalis (strain P15) TaxID=658858 RepID=E1F0V0_GIAIA|nr:Hypothetical protein GLP15_4945 [Giardia lamblia P15]
MIDDISSKVRLFYTQEGVLTLTGPSIPETRGIAALVLLRYLPTLQSIHFTKQSRDILECNETTGDGLDDVYLLTSTEESLRFQDLVQVTLAEEVTPWDSLQQRQKQKANSRYDCLFSVCVLVTGSTLLSTKDKQNLVISDLNLPGNSDVTPTAKYSFYEALYMYPAMGSKQSGGTSSRGVPKLILPGYMLLLSDVSFSMKVPQFPKLMIRPQSQVWNLKEDLPHDWSLSKHREATRLFTQVRLVRACYSTEGQTTILGQEIYNDCFRNMHLKPLASELLARVGEIYKKTVVPIDAEIADFKGGAIQLHTSSNHGSVPVIISEIYRDESYLKEVTIKLAQLAQQHACVLVLLNSTFQQDFIAVTNAPNKFLLYIRDPFEDLFITALECPCDNAPNTNLPEPLPKRVDENKPLSTIEVHGTTGCKDNPLIKGPPLTALLPPYAITSRDICYSLTPDPLTSMSLQDIGEVLDCTIEFLNVMLLWQHVKGDVYPYHRYTRPKESRHLIYSSSSSARILGTTTLLVKVMILNESTGPENVHIAISHALLHELFLHLVPSSVSRDIFELSDPETGADIRDELPCLWPRCVLCTIHKLNISRAKLLILRTEVPLPSDDIPLSPQPGLRYLLDLDASNIR